MKKVLENIQVKYGFTLAEVIITLGIIGVVAGMTIPVLMNSIQDNQFKTAYKKAFSIANNAFKMATADGTAYVPMSSTTDGINACTNWQIFSAQFKKTAVCISNNNGQCWNMASGVETSNGFPTTDAFGFVDDSGMSWSMRGPCAGAADATYFLVDTNGFKSPNKFGKDRWALRWVLDNGNSGTPKKIYLYVNQDMAGGDAWGCPTGPCNYQSWLLN